VAKGYAEGPAAEEAERRREELAAGTVVSTDSGTRLAVMGASAEDPQRHFLGWVGEVDPDELFASGAAWGITVTRVPLSVGGSTRHSSWLQ
jgi:hypothetical protein